MQFISSLSRSRPTRLLFIASALVTPFPSSLDPHPFLPDYGDPKPRTPIFLIKKWGTPGPRPQNSLKKTQKILRHSKDSNFRVCIFRFFQGILGSGLGGTSNHAPSPQKTFLFRWYFWGGWCANCRNLRTRPNTHHPQFCTRDVDRRFRGSGAWISRSEIRGGDSWVLFEEFWGLGWEVLNGVGVDGVGAIFPPF